MSRHVITVVDKDGERWFHSEIGDAKLWAVYWLHTLTVELHRNGALFDQAVGRSIGTHGPLYYLDGFTQVLGSDTHDRELAASQFQLGDQLIIELPAQSELKDIFYPAHC